MDKIIAIIPARYESSRLPGKPLVDIRGRPMIQWVVERVRDASLIDRVMVATDDKRIYDCVRKFGGEVVMSPVDMPSGTDRVAFAAQDLDADIVINVQGDEPFIEPEEVDQVAGILLEDEEAVMGTLVKKITEFMELASSNTAKVVVNENKEAIYFSRNPVPFCRDSSDLYDWLNRHTYYKHVGIYSFRKSFLDQFHRWTPTLLENVEKLEQLRVLEKGYRIKVAETQFEPICVDTPEDLERVRVLAEKIQLPRRHKCGKKTFNLRMT